MKKKYIIRRKKTLTNISIPDFKELIINNKLETLRQFLTQSNFNINSNINGQQTLLHMAYAGNHYRTFEFLLKYGADPFIENQKGYSVYQKALNGPDCRSKQILLQHLEDVKILIKFDQQEIIRARINEGKILSDEDTIIYLLNKNDYSSLNKILQNPLTSALQKKICQHCINTSSIDLYRNVVYKTALKSQFKEELKQTAPWNKSDLSDQQISFLLEIQDFNPDLITTENITNFIFLEKLVTRTGCWRGLKFLNQDKQEFLKQDHINFFKYLESGYQYGVKITSEIPVNHILINTDSPTAKTLFLVGLQLGLLTAGTENLKSLQESIVIEDKIADRFIYHRKSSTKWIKYEYAGINSNGMLQYYPLDTAQNTCDGIQFFSHQDFMENVDTTKYLTTVDSPVTIRENNINLEQHTFIRKYWRISPLWLQLLLEQLKLPCIFISDIVSRKHYNDLIINIEGRDFRLSDIFPLSTIDYNEAVIKPESNKIEPGISLLIGCGVNTDVLNFISTPTEKIYHIIDMDLYAHKPDNLHRLISWSDESPRISGRIYTMCTGTFCSYFSHDLIKNHSKHQWQVKFLDTGISDYKAQNNPAIKLIQENLYSEFKSLIDHTITKNDREVIKEFLYKYYQSTGNSKDRKNIQSHLTHNEYISQLFFNEANEFSLPDIRLSLLREANESTDRTQIITGTGITKKALSSHTQFSSAILTTQGEKKLLNHEQINTALIITCWSGRRTIRLLTSRRFAEYICLFDAAGKEYTEKLLQLLNRLEDHFKKKNTLPLSEFKTSFRSPLKDIYSKHTKEDLLDEEFEYQDNFFLNYEFEKQSITELKKKYEMEKKTGSFLLIFDDNSILLLRENEEVFSCECQREKHPAELDSGETIITFDYKDKKYTDITKILIKTDIINRFFSRTQGWRELLCDQFSNNDYNEIYKEICTKILEIDVLTFHNWTDRSHYQIGPQGRKAHREIYKLYSPGLSEKAITDEWRNISRFRSFKQILGNRLGDIINSYQNNHSFEATTAFRQIFNHLELREKENQILFKQMKKIIKSAEEKTIKRILTDD